MVFKTDAASMAFANENDYVTWSNRYSVGIQVIDDQHKELLNLVNDLYHHSNGNEAEERDYFKKVIHQTINYVKEHFSTEEKLLIAARFPGYEAHKKAHDAFVREVLKSVKEYEDGKRLALVHLAHFLKDWILTHIAVMDIQYAEYFKYRTGNAKKP